MQAPSTGFNPPTGMLQKTFALTERSLRVDARGLQGHLLRFLLAGAVLLTLSVLGSDTTTAPGLALMSMLAYGNAVMITLAAPIFFGSCITEEKEERTLPLLLMADIGPLAILSGKLLPKLLTVLLILTVQVPFTLLAITLGGVLLDQVLSIYLASAAYLIGIAGLGVFCSVVFRQSSNAIGGVGMLLLLYYVGPPLVWAFGTWASLSSAGAGAALVGSAQLVMETNIFSRLGGILAVSGTAEYLTGQVISNALCGAFAFGLAWLLFDRCNRDLDAEPVKKRSAKVRAGTTLPSRRVWDWPVCWKEFHFLGGGRRMLVGKLIGYGCVLLLLAVMMSDFGRRSGDADEIAGVMVFIMTFAAGIELTLLLARTFSMEIKEQTWSTLNLLPYSVPKLAYSKILGLIPALTSSVVWLLLALVVSGALPAFARQLARHPDDTSYFIGVTVGHFLLFLHLVTFYSVIMRNSWGGLVAGLLTHYFGAIIVGMMLYLVLELGLRGGGGMGDLFTVLNLVCPWLFAIGLHILILRMLRRDVELR